jgi:multiple sugar transport system ATP-binding protein
MGVLAIDGLRKSFGVKRALRGIDLTVGEGEVLALLGPTGAGKTTTLRCISGLERPDAGRVMLDDRDVTLASPRERDVAVVFEGFNLLPTLSVYDNIAFPLRSPVYRLPENAVRAEVARAAETLRIARLLERRIDQLSGGERQRVAIARALVRQPRLYLLDEPLSALDLKLRESLQVEIREMYKTTGATVIYASHDFPSAAAIASRMALIEGGRIVQSGTLAELMADPRHASVGRLIGSPSMALFPTQVVAGRAEVEGLPGGFEVRAGHGRITIGIWPDDIAIAPGAGPDVAEGRVYATDFRGRDQAIEVRFGAHRFRKVVGLDVTLQQGDACFFRVPAARAFLFSAETGERLDGTGAGP